MSNLASQQIRIPPERIHFLKFILEGYDNLAVLSTVERKEGLVEIRYPSEQEEEIKQLLASLMQALS